MTARGVSHSIPDLSKIAFETRDICQTTFDAPAADRPMTLDRGAGRAPVVSMCYQGTPADMLCVAHEFGHALQYHLAQGRFVPPILRELAAFLAEAVLLRYVQREDPQLAAPLKAAARADDAIYLGQDGDLLRAALDDPQAAYDYRLNYPVARHLAHAVTTRSQPALWERIFRAQLTLPEMLARRQTGLANTLPAVPDPDQERPAINAYRVLGMMVLLDIETRQGEPDKAIETYYAARLAHLQAQTSLVAVDRAGKPFGYALWDVDPADPDLITLKRQAAPFGDHLELQERLQAQLPATACARSHHPRSARQEQTAW